MENSVEYADAQVLVALLADSRTRRRSDEP